MQAITGRALLLIAAALCGASTRAVRAETPKPDPSHWLPVQIAWDQKIVMRDGVRISVTIYRNPKQTAPLPAVMSMTPYIAEGLAKRGMYFAQHGYVFVAVDARGRGNSEGAFVPGRVEARDGYDVIEWIAKQPWCNGQVATMGGSWGGFTQWSIAKEFPPHLKAIAPTAPVYPGVDYPHRYGIIGAYTLRWLSYVHGRTLNSGPFENTDLWRNAVYELVTSGRAFQDLEDITGMKGTVFRTWLAHPREDAYWQAITPSPEHYAKLRIPILTVTGHYDADQLGALTYYERHLANGPRDVTARHWLVMGPWDHAGTRQPKAELGGVTFGSSAVMDMEELARLWFDHVLKGGPAPEFLRDRVACFIAGRNTWVYASDLKQLEGAATKLALDLTGAAPGDVTQAGRLTTQAPSAPANVMLTTNPRFLEPQSEVDAMPQEPAYLKDQRDAYTLRPNQIIWHSAPFPAETVLAGRARLRIQLASDQPDADLFVYLAEVLPDGTVVDLSETSLRLRYRAGGIAGSPMIPGKPELIRFPPFGFFARAIAKGSRLRLMIHSGPTYWGVQRNSHTGGDLATEPLAKARIARITLMTGPDSGTELELPRPDEAVLQRKDEPAKRR
jgi:putative CocE/NonD family hydrolase